VRRRIAFLILGVAMAGLPVVALSSPAQAAGITTTTITSPADDSHYLVTDAQPATTVLVKGTSNGTLGESVDLRCYTSSVEWTPARNGVPVDADGSFTTLMRTDQPFGTCILRAVPAGLPGGSNLSRFVGPRISGEMIRSVRVGSGPNAAKTFDYDARYQGARGFNGYFSATHSSAGSSRLQYADGTSSSYLWGSSGVGSLFNPKAEADRAPLRIDGQIGYGPFSAAFLYAGSIDTPGLPALTYDATRDPATGDTVIHEHDPIVVCPTDTYPPTAESCPHFDPTGVQLDRTIVTSDDGARILVSDAWRSTDGRAHTVAVQYSHTLAAADNTPPASDTPVGLDLPWLGGGYRRFATATAFPGPGRVPASMLVRDNDSAADGDRRFPRGAISVDVAPARVRWATNKQVVFDYDAIAVPAGGFSQPIRQAFVMGTSEAEVASAAAAQRDQINPYRPDALIRRAGARHYVGGDVLDGTGARQTVTRRVRRGHGTSFVVRVENDGSVPDSYAIKGVRSGHGVSVRYFAGARGHKEITRAVRRGRYRLTNLAPGQARVVRVVVTVTGHLRRAGRALPVRVRSLQDAGRVDTVRARVRTPR
jgi:hypothetical protein